MIPFKVVTPSNTLAVSVDEFKTHLMLFGDDSYDSELQSFLFVAQEYVAGHVGNYIGDTVIHQPFKDFEDVTLQHRNASNISVVYYDVDNAQQTLAASGYLIDTNAQYPKIQFEKPTPVGSEDYDNVGYVEYTTSIDHVSSKIKHAILIMASDLFNRRDANWKDTNCQEVINRLLNTEKRVVV